MSAGAETPRATAVAVVVLAAGHGKRMRSSLPKVLHEAAGRPIAEHVLRAARSVEPDRIVVVVGHGSERVRERLAAPDVEFVEQPQQRGTGDALAVAEPALAGFHGTLLVLTGDAPLTAGGTLQRLVDEHRRHGDPTLLTYEVADPSGLGRIVRGADGSVDRIVEEKDASDAQRALREVSPGLFAFDEGVFDLVRRLDNRNRSGEYYLTDVVALYRAAGRRVRALRGDDEMASVIGVNTRAQLAAADRLLRERVRRRWLEAGVTLQAPEMTFLDDEVELARDVVLEPGVVLRGACRVGAGARIGAYSVLEACRVGEGALVPPHSVARGRSFEAA